MSGERIGLVQVDGKLPNLALMKISSYYKAIGAKVGFVEDGQKYDKVFASVLFTWNRDKALELIRRHNNIEIGGTGYDLTKTLPAEIESCRPDYDLYTPEAIYAQIQRGIKRKETVKKKAIDIANMGIGFTSRGCFRKCGFCFVPRKEGALRQETSIAEIINPRSRLITLYDNNMTADPDCIEKLEEIKARELVVDISQGVDVRITTDEIAHALSEVKHMRSIHYAWDLMAYEEQVMDGIATLSKWIKPWRQMCFVLAGYDTTHEEDMYRVMKLADMKISPYVMKYNNRSDDLWLNHFARWVNGRFYKACDFEEYLPWKKASQGGIA